MRFQRAFGALDVEDCEEYYERQSTKEQVEHKTRLVRKKEKDIDRNPRQKEAR